MPEKEKKNGMISMFKGVLKGRKEVNVDIVTQAENAVSDYINKRKNAIADKYCKKKNTFKGLIWTMVCIGALYLAYLYLS